jgi:hypothetical protein
MARYVDLYNNEHRHSGIKYVTPAQCHAGQDHPLLTARHELYQRTIETAALAADPLAISETKSGSHETRRWRKKDSNPRSPGHGEFCCHVLPHAWLRGIAA